MVENWTLKKIHEVLSEGILDHQTIKIETINKDGKNYLHIKWYDADNGLHEHDHELTGNRFKGHTGGDDYNLAGHFENLGGLKILVGHARLHKNGKNYYAAVTAVKA